MVWINLNRRLLDTFSGSYVTMLYLPEQPDGAVHNWMGHHFPETAL